MVSSQVRNMEFLPIELVFNPNWWYRNYSIRFDKPYYFDPETRIENDMLMRRVLYERYGELGLGERDPQPRPIIGSMHVAGGFVIPALFGAEVIFREDQAPWVRPMNLTDEEVWRLEPPCVEATWPLREMIADMDTLEAHYGWVIGDFDTDGVLNTALSLRGEPLFLDLHDNPPLIHHLFTVIADTQAKVARYLRRRTGSCAIATNRIITKVEPSMYLHSNCSVQMISPDSYKEFLLPYEIALAEQLPPYGIHHCGDNMHLFAPTYAHVSASFFDVGWGSDVPACRNALPDAFFSLRLSPVRMLQCRPYEIATDIEKLLLAAEPLGRAGVCCINMDYDTPDENIFAVYEVVQRYRRSGA